MSDELMAAWDHRSKAGFLIAIAPIFRDIPKEMWPAVMAAISKHMRLDVQLIEAEILRELSREPFQPN